MSMHSSLTFHQVDKCESTQDECKSLLLKRKSPFVAVSAQQQVKGRGTSGRDWKGISGNVFLTVALPMDKIPVQVTLLPLQVGICICNSLESILKTLCKVSPSKLLKLKWPNDVLLESQKVAGVLIESTIVDNETYLLVGIGINIKQAPNIPTVEGRQATCLQDYCENTTLPSNTAQVVAADLANRLVEWIEDTDSNSNNNNIVETWRKWAEFHTPQKLRETGEMVTPLDIQEDGQLLVELENGQERLLVAEYLY